MRQQKCKFEEGELVVIKPRSRKSTSNKYTGRSGLIQYIDPNGRWVNVLLGSHTSGIIPIDDVRPLSAE